MNYGIGNVKGGGGVSNTMLTTTTDATENSGTYTLDLTYLSEIPKVNDYVVYVNSGAITTLYQVSAVGSTNATLEKIGDIGGGGGSGTTLYQHNLTLVGKFNNSAYDIRLCFTIISDSATALTKSDLHTWLTTNGFSGATDGDFYPASAMCNDSSILQSNVLGIASYNSYFYTYWFPTWARSQITNTTLYDKVIELGIASISGGGGGNKKYLHNIYMYNSTTREIILTIENDNNTPIDKTALKSFLVDNGFTYYRNPYKCVANYDSSVYVGICVAFDDLSLSRLGSGVNIESVSFTINDTVVAL